MPPKSRGAVVSDHFEASSEQPDALSPASRSYLRNNLDQLHHGSVLSPGQTTPKRPASSSADDDQPTPLGRRLVVEDEDEDEDDEGGEDDGDGHVEDGDSLDDDEFESHYSRQESPVSSEGDEDEADEEDEDVVEMSPIRSRLHGYGDNIQRVSSVPLSVSFSNHTSHLHMSHSTTSLPRTAPPIPPPLYPPFYNRPPTPLPPSPSLTSLLRPPSILNRSTTSTRPTTPDSSDFETPATNDDTEAAMASSARRANPLPPTSPKVPTYEYYGFVLYLASTLTFFLYLFWAYLPSPFLHALGITYYPNRWWALAVPAWIVMLLVYIYVALACWNVEYLTLGLARVETMVDDAGNVAILDEQGRIKKGGSKRYERELMDKQQREKSQGSIGKKRTSGGHHGGSGRKKDKRKRDKDRDRDDEWRFGYTGEVFNGTVACGLTWTQIWNEGTDAVMDVPIGGVCEVLYGQADAANSDGDIDPDIADSVL